MMNIGALTPFESASLLQPKKPNFTLTSPLSPFISKNAMFVSSSQQNQQTHLSFKTRHNGLSLLCVSAVKNKRRKAGNEVMESDGSDFDDFDADYADDGEDNDDEEDDGMSIPFGKMKRWLENRPRGFGVGKMYDTSLEDKLLQEIEQSREAQIANINKLKSESVQSSSKKDEQKKNAPEDSSTGIRVRVCNLPKKKNIHRDLKSVFEAVPGIISIMPSVSGNKKTKDPICKGFAFVDFKSEEYATRFIQSFSRQNIVFGKVQKQIRCEMMNSSSSSSVDDTGSHSKITVTGCVEDTGADFDENDDSGSLLEAVSNGSEPDDKLEFAELEEVRENLEFVTVSELNDSNNKKQAKESAASSSSSGSLLEAVSDGSEPDDKLKFAELEEVRENLEFVTVSELNDSKNKKQAKESAASSSSSNQQKTVRKIEKKLMAKGKVKRVQKLAIPGSAKRLKIKEKAMLTDVLSKYSVKATSTAKEES